MRYVFVAALSMSVAVSFPAAPCKAFPLTIGVGGGFLAPAGDFGQDITGGMSVTSGFAVFPVEKLRIGLHVSYASLKGKGNNGLVLEMLNGELHGRYTLHSFTEDVGLYGLLGTGYSLVNRSLGTGEEKGYQLSGILGGGTEFHIAGGTMLDAGILFRRYFSKKPGDLVFLNIGFWHKL